MLASKLGSEWHGNKRCLCTRKTDLMQNKGKILLKKVFANFLASIWKKIYFISIWLNLNAWISIEFFQKVSVLKVKKRELEQNVNSFMLFDFSLGFKIFSEKRRNGICCQILTVIRGFFSSPLPPTPPLSSSQSVQYGRVDRRTNDSLTFRREEKNIKSKWSKAIRCLQIKISRNENKFSFERHFKLNGFN